MMCSKTSHRKVMERNFQIKVGKKSRKIKTNHRGAQNILIFSNLAFSELLCEVLF